MPSPSLGFVLFVILNGVMILRPTEVVEDFHDLPLYELVILACLATAFPRVLEQLAPRSLARRPITACVVGMLAAVALSPLARLSLGEAFDSVSTFYKVVLTYLLMVGVIRSGAQLRQFLRWLAVFVLGLTVLGLLQYHGVIDNPALAPVGQREFDDETGEVSAVPRLCGAGIFANPNDLSRILVVGMVVAVYSLSDRRQMILWPFWLAALGTLGYALNLTHSRGGFIALLTSVATLFGARFGARKAVLLAGALLPALFFVYEGRQTELTTAEGTGQQRIQLWSEGMNAMRSSPLLGTGMGTYEEHTGGLGAHNSFVHSYVELGFLGGTFFLGAFACALWVPARLGRHRARIADPEVRRLGPFVLAILAGYAAGMLSSSRNYAMPTYMLLGVAAAYLRLAGAPALLPAFRVGPRSAARLALVSVVVLAAIQVYVRVAVRWN